jgi:hypothetical protein
MRVGSNVARLVRRCVTLTTAVLVLSISPATSQVTPIDQAEDKTIDEQFAEVARREPHFGGFFYDEGPALVDVRTLYVYSRDTSAAVLARIRTAMNAVIGARRLPAFRIVPIRGQYSFLELLDWRERANVFELVGVVTADIDETTNSLAIGVDRTPGAAETVAQRMAGIGVPAAAFRVEVVEPPADETSLQDFHRPLVGGLQIQSFFGTCTLGIVARATLVVPNQDVYVMNSHCTPIQGTIEGVPHFQPAFGANLIGVEVYDPPFQFCFPITTLPCRFSDSAFGLVDPGASRSRGRIALPAVLNSVAWNGVTTLRVVAEIPPWKGLTVQKVGRSTGRTSGSVQRTCLDVKKSGGWLARCQAQASYGSAGGDSGAPVFLRLANSNDVALVGLHWGSNGTFSPIQNLQKFSELGPLNTCAPGFSC